MCLVIDKGRLAVHALGVVLSAYWCMMLFQSILLPPIRARFIIDHLIFFASSVAFGLCRRTGLCGILAVSILMWLALLPEILLIPFSHDVAANVWEWRWGLFAVVLHSSAMTVGFLKRRMFVKW